MHVCVTVTSPPPTGGCSLPSSLPFPPSTELVQSEPVGSGSADHCLLPLLSRQHHIQQAVCVCWGVETFESNDWKTSTSDCLNNAKWLKTYRTVRVLFQGETVFNKTQLAQLLEKQNHSTIRISTRWYFSWLLQHYKRLNVEHALYTGGRDRLWTEEAETEHGPHHKARFWGPLMIPQHGKFSGPDQLKTSEGSRWSYYHGGWAEHPSPALFCPPNLVPSLF